MARLRGVVSLALTTLVIALFAIPTSTTAQASFGIPPFSTVGGGPDAINLSNLSFLYTVPLFSRAGRGSSVSIVQHLENDLWSPGYNSNFVMQWLLSFPPPSNGAGFVFYSGPVHKTCNDGGTVDYYVYTFTGYYDSSGTSHPFNLRVSDLNDSGGTCYNPNKQNPDINSGVSSDGSGVSMTVTDSPLTAVVTLRNGTVIHAPLATYNGYYTSGTPGPFTAIDSNGNEITVNGTGLSITSIVDTLGTSAATFGSNSVSYTAPSGASATATYSTTRYNVQTAFNCPGVAEYPATPFDTVTSITLPDGSYYQITYEPTSPGSQNVTGRIASVRLPTGATISYTYTGGDTGKGIVCADGSTAGFNRSTPDGIWHYLRSNIVGQCCTGVTSSTTTITDPQGNNTVINFGGNHETQRQVYTGAATGTPVETVITCYNGNTTNCGTAAGGGTAAPTEINSFHSFNGGPQSEVDTFYNSFGLATATNVYDFGATTPTRKTTITYDSTLGNGILDRPSQVTVTDGNNNLKSQTNYVYDEDQATLQPSGASQRVSVTCGTGFTKCRGNVTTIKRYVTATSTLNSTFTHYDTGQVYQATDVNGAVSTNTYAACGHSFLTNVSLPLSLSKSFGWNCTGGVMTSSTDENGQTSYINYTTDHHFWRPESTKDQLGNITSLTYASLVRSEASLQVTSSAYVDVTKTLDSLGRPSLTQVKQALGSSNFDTVYQTYDSDGRPFHAFMPCVALLGAGCSTPSTTSYYDGMGRMIQSKDGSNAVVQNLSYNQNDSYTDVVAPTGENDKRKQLQHDGLGRLTSVCEITSNSTDTYWGTCAQTTSQNGYWTTYAYDLSPNYNSLTVTQNVQKGTSQTRTYIYDMLGRLTQETNPETKTTNYTYDLDSSGVCPGTYTGDLVKRIDASNEVSCYAYDQLHRLLSVTYSGGHGNSDPKYFVYDAATVNGTVMQFAKGRMAEAYTCPPAGCGSKKTDLGISYSGRGEPAAVYEMTPHSVNYYSATASYWPHGTLNQLGSTLAGLPTIYYGASDGTGLDSQGRVTKVTASSGQNPTTSVIYTTSGTSQPIGSLTKVVYGSSDNDNFSYDTNTGRLNQYVFDVGTTPQTVTGNLGWNVNGSLATLGITDQLNSQNSQSCTFGYDDLGRSATANCSTAWNQTFSFDPFGNIAKTANPGVTFLPTYNEATNRYTSLPGCTPTYETNGALTNDCAHTYLTNNSGNLTQIDTIILVYDALGRMVEQNNGGVYTQIVYGPTGMKYALMNGATLKSAFVPLPGGGTAVYNSSGLAYYRHADWLGSSRLATHITQSSQASYYYDGAYAPYGENYAGSGTTDLNFTGQGQDTAVGLFDFLYREYNSAQSRWAGPDPAGLQAVSMANPQTWNRYAYVGNNPLNAVDPFGLHEPNELATYNHDDGLQALLDPGGAWLNSQTQQFLIQAGLNSPMQQGLATYLSSIPGYSVKGGELYWHVGFFTPNPKYDPNTPGSVIGTETVSDFDLGPIGGSANSDSWAWTFTKSFFGGLVSSGGWKAVYHSVVDEGGCDRLMFTTFAGDFNPLPGDGLGASDAVDLGPKVVAQAGRTAASAYSAYQGLSVPLRSSIYRGLQSSTYGSAAALAEAAPYLQVGYAGGDALVTAGMAAYNGQCH